MTSRRNFLGTITGALAASMGGAQPAARPPNIVFILADDLGWGDLGCYGNRFIKTPNLDRLARQGSLFTQFYVSAPVCSPSRTGFLTGQCPSRHRIYTALGGPVEQAEFLDPKAPMVSRVLQQAGYATAHFGKWHLGGVAAAPEPSAYGFDEYRTYNGVGRSWKDEHDPFFRAHSSAYIVDESILFMEKNRTRPFYIDVWSLVPHAVLNPTEEQMKPYEQFGPIGVPYKGAAQVYYASVTDLDTQVGRLLAKIEELGIAGNTIVLFSSDNGPEDISVRNASHSGVGSPGPFRGRKRSLYEGGLRLPLIVRWPGHVPAGRVDDSAVITGVDFLPTIVHLAGAHPPSGYQGDGEDAGDALLGRHWTRTKPIFWEWRYDNGGHVLNHSPRLVMREGYWKLLMNPDRSRMELYDIPRDPSELDNRAAREPAVVSRMAEKLMAWQKSLPAGPISPNAGRNSYAWPKATAK